MQNPSTTTTSTASMFDPFAVPVQSSAPLPSATTNNNNVMNANASVVSNNSTSTTTSTPTQMNRGNILNVNPNANTNALVPMTHQPHFNQWAGSIGATQPHQYHAAQYQYHQQQQQYHQQRQQVNTPYNNNMVAPNGGPSPYPAPQQQQQYYAMQHPQYYNQNQANTLVQQNIPNNNNNNYNPGAIQMNPFSGPVPGPAGNQNHLAVFNNQVRAQTQGQTQNNTNILQQAPQPQQQHQQQHQQQNSVAPVPYHQPIQQAPQPSAPPPKPHQHGHHQEKTPARDFNRSATMPPLGLRRENSVDTVETENLSRSGIGSGAKNKVKLHANTSAPLLPSYNGNGAGSTSPKSPYSDVSTITPNTNTRMTLTNTTPAASTQQQRSSYNNTSGHAITKQVTEAPYSTAPPTNTRQVSSASIAASGERTQQTLQNDGNHRVSYEGNNNNDRKISGTDDAYERSIAAHHTQPTNLAALIPTPPGASPLPNAKLVRQTGYVLSRISLRTIFMKKWKQSYWMRFGSTVLLLFRSKADADDWLNNPYHSLKERNFLIKLKIDFVRDLEKPNVRGYRAARITNKMYKGELYHQFKLERWMDYGPAIACAFASQESQEVQVLREVVLSCMQSSPRHSDRAGAQSMTTNQFLHQQQHHHHQSSTRGRYQQRYANDDTQVRPQYPALPEPNRKDFRRVQSYAPPSSTGEYFTYDDDVLKAERDQNEAAMQARSNSSVGGAGASNTIARGRYSNY